MFQTKQLSSDTIVFYVQGPFHQSIAKELSLAVFRSHHLGFTTFLLDLSHVSLLDDRGSHQLALIGKGLQEKGGTWKVIKPPSSAKYQLILQTSLQEFPHAMWN